MLLRGEQMKICIPAWRNETLSLDILLSIDSRYDIRGSRTSQQSRRVPEASGAASRSGSEEKH